MKNVTYKNINNSVIAVFENGVLVNNIEVNAHAYYSIDSSQRDFDLFKSEEVAHSFSFGHCNSVPVYVLCDSQTGLTDEAEKKAFKISQLRKMKKPELSLCLMKLGSLLGWNSQLVSKGDLIDELMQITKAQYIEKVFKEYSHKAYSHKFPFPCVVEKVNGYSQGDCSYIVKLENNAHINYEYYQKIFYSIPVYCRLEIRADNIDYTPYNLEKYLTDVYSWDKSCVLDYVKSKGFSFNDVLIEILDNILPENLETY